MKENRRDFLKKSGGCAIGMVSLATQMHHLGSLSALAQSVIDSGDGGDSYKALVLCYFAGGNDGNNVVIPNHNDATISNYAAYSAARSTQGLAFSQAELAATSITVPRLGNLAYALHPRFKRDPVLEPINGTTIVNEGVFDLWGAGDMAVVCNVGTLVRPLTKAQYLSSSFQKPYQLFSHSDQVGQSQTSISSTQAFTGWGGRLSDRMTAGSNPSGLVPMITSIAGAQLFTAGQTTLPLAIANAQTSLANVLNPAGFGTNPTGSTLARLTAFNALRQQDLSNNFIKEASHVTDLAMQANSVLQTSQEVTTLFPTTNIGQQFKQVARLIKKRLDLNVNRQVFYVQIGGFDTHTNELNEQNGQNARLREFSQAMRAFYDEMVAQGVNNDVTTFTLSDFNRTLNPAGSGASVGTDHAWGNHMFVMGGAVSGGDFYGSKRPDGTGNYYPTLVMGPSGADDTDNTASGRGRWIPTTSVEMYAVRLARWFGLSPADETLVFPNLANSLITQHDAANSALNFIA